LTEAKTCLRCGQSIRRKAWLWPNTVRPSVGNGAPKRRMKKDRNAPLGRFPALRAMRGAPLSRNPAELLPDPQPRCSRAWLSHEKAPGFGFATAGAAASAAFFAALRAASCREATSPLPRRSGGRRPSPAGERLDAGPGTPAAISPGAPRIGAGTQHHHGGPSLRIARPPLRIGFAGEFPAARRRPRRTPPPHGGPGPALQPTRHPSEDRRGVYMFIAPPL